MTVISLGGSIVAGEEINLEYILKFREFLQKYSKRYKFYVVVGGGKTARKYIMAGQKLKLNQYILDDICLLYTSPSPRDS